VWTLLHTAADWRTRVHHCGAGTGIDIVYPRATNRSPRNIAAGALVSESARTPPNAGIFPGATASSRVCRGCLVAKPPSFRLAHHRTPRRRTGREVRTPARSTRRFKGLSRAHQAGSEAGRERADVLEELGAAVVPETTSPQPSSGHDLLDKMGSILRYRRPDRAQRLDGEIVSSILLRLELEGKVAGLPGGLYQRVR